MNRTANETNETNETIATTGTAGIDRITVAVAASTRRRFALGLIPAAFAAVAAGSAGMAGIGAVAPAAADSRSRKKRKNKRPQRPERPVAGPIITPPPGGTTPIQTVIEARYELGTLGTLIVTGAGFDPNHEVTLSVKMDWSPTLEVYLVQFSATVTADATGAFEWSGSGYCPRVIDVYADQGSLHAHAHVEDYSCPW